MSDFITRVVAQLDTKQAKKQLAKLTKSEKKKITIDIAIKNAGALKNLEQMADNVVKEVNGKKLGFTIDNSQAIAAIKQIKKEYDALDNRGSVAPANPIVYDTPKTNTVQAPVHKVETKADAIEKVTNSDKVAASTGGLNGLLDIITKITEKSGSVKSIRESLNGILESENVGKTQNSKYKFAQAA